MQYYNKELNRHFPYNYSIRSLEYIAGLSYFKGLFIIYFKIEIPISKKITLFQLFKI